MPLTIQYQPISITFGVFDLSEGTTSSHSNSIVQLAADPTGIEEEVAIGRVTLSINRQGEILSLVKIGGTGLDPDLIQTKCLDLAKLRAVQLADKLNAELAARSA